jgi:hypothetical protein
VKSMNFKIEYYSFQLDPRLDDDDGCDIESEEDEDQEEVTSEPQNSSTKWADMSMLTEEEKLDILSERDFGHQTGIKGFDEIVSF